MGSAGIQFLNGNSGRWAADTGTGHGDRNALQGTGISQIFPVMGDLHRIVKMLRDQIRPEGVARETLPGRNTYFPTWSEVTPKCMVFSSLMAFSFTDAFLILQRVPCRNGKWLPEPHGSLHPSR